MASEHRVPPSLCPLTPRMDPSGEGSSRPCIPHLGCSGLDPPPNRQALLGPPTGASSFQNPSNGTSWSRASIQDGEKTLLGQMCRCPPVILPARLLIRPQSPLLCPPSPPPCQALG